MTLDLTTFWDALGWAVLHSLWQGALIGLVVWLVRALLTDRRAKLRYLVGMAGLVGTCLAFLSTFALLLVSGRRLTAQLDPVASTTADAGAVPVDFSVVVGVFPVETIASDMPGALISLLGMVWAVGFTFLSLQAYRAWSRTRWLATNGLRTPGREWRMRFDTLIQRLDASEHIRLYISDHVSGPMTLGALRPIVLVPAGFLTGLPSAQVEAILLHELAHIRRHDFLFGLIQTAIKTILYFNPAVLLMSRAVDADREQACDDMAVTVTGQPADLVRGLAALRLRSAAPELVMAADGGPLLDRLNRLMGRPVQRRSLGIVSNRLSAAALSALMLGTAACTSVSMANPQPPQAPAAPEADLPDTVVRSELTWPESAPTPPTPVSPEVRVWAQAPNLNAAIPPVPAMPAMPPMPALPPVPVAPAMPALPDVPVPLFSDYDSEDAFEEAMEAWGEQMEAWGEEVEARFEGDWEAEMEAWGKEVEARFEGDWEVEMEAWGEEMEAWGEEMEALGETLEELQDLEDRELRALGLSRAELDNRLRVIEQRAEAEERRSEAEAERIEAQVERQMAEMERVERQIEREQERAERQVERQVRMAERDAERAMRKAERRHEPSMRHKTSHTSTVTVDGDHGSIIMAGQRVDVAQLRTGLLDALADDGLIRKGQLPVKIDLCSEGMDMNGRALTTSQQKRYREIIQGSGLSLDGALEMKFKTDSTRIELSKDRDDHVTMTVGTYDSDNK